MLTRARMMIAILAGLVMLVTPAVAVAGPLTSDPASVPGPFVLDPMDALRTQSAIRLSDEAKVTRWANAADPHPVYAEPTRGSSVVGRLRYLTEDKLPEVYLVLEGKLDAQGDGWLHIRVPGRPNGKTGWVPEDMLSRLHVVQTQLTIDRTAKRATLRKAGRTIWSAPVGIGKASTPTPQGKFWVREVLKGNGGSYGPWAIGTSAYSNLSDWPKGGVVGIHGTNQPGLIPGSPSHGCVRVRNPKMIQLKRLMPIGTPIDIIR